MKQNQKETNKQKHQFKTYYCAGCIQSKPCQLLTGWDSKWQSYCCQCYFQNEQEKAKEYSNYQKLFQQKFKEKETNFKQYQLLKNYLGCPQCKSKSVDAYSLYEKNQLICQLCLVKKTGGSSSPINFSEQVKWYKKHWKIDLKEWLDKFQQLPVNKNCAERCQLSVKQKWLKDRNHLNNCQCLEKEAKETYLLFSNSLKKMEERLKKCSCEKSEKFRVSGDYSTWCQKCEKSVAVASKKRVIRNRNNPGFWGLEVKERVLCLRCIGEKFYGRMVGWQRKKWREYRRRGYI